MSKIETLGDKRIKLVDLSFNLPGPGYKALFLVGKFEIPHIDAPELKVLLVYGAMSENCGREIDAGNKKC